MPTISSKHNPLFRNAAKAFLDKGWPANALLPGIPIGATMLPASHVKTGSIGKVPGEWLGTMWKGMEGAWASKGLAGATVGQGRTKQPLDTAAIDTWPTDQVCIAGYEVCGLDIDGGADVVDIVRPIFEAWAGEDAASVRKRDDGSDRCMAPFRPAGGPGSIPSSSVTFIRGTERVLIEIKGKGYHWTGAGGHPEGCSYVWTAGVPPYAALPALDVETVSLMRQAIIKAMEGAGWAVSTQHASGGGKDQSVLNARCLISPATASKVMAGAENNLNWDDAVGILAALRGAMGSEGAVPPDGVYAWAMKHPGSSHDWLDRRWHSLEVVRSGVGGLVKWLNNPTKGNRPDLAALIDGEADLTRTLGVLDVDEEAAAEPGEPPGDLVAARDRLIDRIVDKWVFYGNGPLWLNLDERGEGVTSYAMKQSGFDMERDCVSLSEIDHAIRLEAHEARPPGPRGGRGQEPKRRSAQAILLDNWKRVRHVRGAAASYGDDVLVPAQSGSMRLNTAVMKVIPEMDVGDDHPDVIRFLAFVADLIPKPEQAEMALSWLTWLLQNPRDKIRWSLVQHGMQGSGKDVFIGFLVHAVGVNNQTSVTAEQLTGRFTGHVGRRLVRVSEAQQHDRADFYDKFKQAVTGDGSGQQNCELKGKDHFNVVDRCAFVINTNHDNALSIPPDDRRLYVYGTRDLPPAEDIEARKAALAPAHALAKWRDEGGWIVIANWMLKRQQCALFDPNDCPPATEEKLAMMAAASPRGTQWLKHGLETGSGPFGGRTVISPGYAKAWVQNNPHMIPTGIAHITDKQIADALHQLGWVKLVERINLPGDRLRRLKISAWVSSKDLAGAGGNVIAARFMREERAMRGVNDGSGSTIWGVDDDPAGKDRDDKPN